MLSREVIKVIQYHRFFLLGGISVLSACVCTTMCSCVAHRSKVFANHHTKSSNRVLWVFTDVSGPLPDHALWKKWNCFKVSLTEEPEPQKIPNR